MDQQLGSQASEAAELKKVNEKEFKKDFAQLLAGVNRIRYLKSKQKKNQVKMLQYLNKLSQNTERKKEDQYKSAPKLNNSCRVAIVNAKKSFQFKKIRSPFQNNLTFQEDYYSSINSNRSKLFHYSCQGKYKKDYFQSKPTESTLSNNSINADNLQPNIEKLAALLSKKKTQNYQQMKQLRLKNQEYERQRKEAFIHAARIRRQEVRTSQQNGRKRMNQHYFQHLQAIKHAKLEEKERKLRITEKQFQELSKLQQLQIEELQKYQHSLIIGCNLKELIEKSNKETNSKKVFRKPKIKLQ